MPTLKGYRSIEDFEREEIRSNIKLGWSLDDLYQDARNIERSTVEEDGDPRELKFDY